MSTPLLTRPRPGRGDMPKMPVKEVKPPKEEHLLVAYKARHKQTLHGNLGTGNRISPVIQFPICGRDPLNFCRNEAGVLSAEERRVLRVIAKHSVREFRGTERFAEAVYNVEQRLIDGFKSSEDVRHIFFKNEVYASRLAADLAKMVCAQVRGDKVAERVASPNLDEIPKQPLIPHQHDIFCGPVCICLKSAASALDIDTGRLHELPVPHHKRLAAATDKMIEDARLAAVQRSASSLAMRLPSCPVASDRQG
mmetsp:Transcript_68856/g.128522  ORF Transcript_68856/g.128522 Transcript_68856/m.128522 type:complete len:252 (-) Transcript_68856:15-770(-)